MYEEKIKSIEDYIQRIDVVLAGRNITEAYELLNLIIAVYRNEIPRITSKLATYTYGADNADYFGDLSILKAKLKNYKTNLSSGLCRQGEKGEDRIVFSPNISQTVNTNIEITLESTISCINALSNNVLSDDDKDVLNGKLAAISAATDKPTRWEKAKSTLKWIAEKGIEVGVAALPYIVEALKK